MLAHLRRFLLVVCVAYAFGGFFFYASVVIPVGSATTDPTTQGFVTRQVTRYLNLAQGLAVTLCLCEVTLRCRGEPESRSRILRRQLPPLAVVAKPPWFAWT